MQNENIDRSQKLNNIFKQIHNFMNYETEMIIFYIK